ncbi:MAG TPA: hypothetical protein VHN15_14435 [Thermoanaerobaculia bacterium]|nr:hypothetical protein [Thermoanaerobaculia bacterium]
MTARADLHVHSKHSNRPSEWILRQFGAPESFTEPKEVYRICRERGMDFVTLSDHDTIDGALEIAHLPGTFLSCEVTVSFPEDGCQLHCLVTGITERQHRDIQELRGNVYELRDYFRDHGVLYSIAHPFHRVNDRLTLDHLEKLIVLFNRFEALNGIHDRRLNDLTRRLFGSLTREVVEDLAERHRLEPLGPTPWVKTFTGGSDDHGGFYIATTYTATPPARTVEEYLAHLRAGHHEPGGDTGSTMRLVQSLYSISGEYYSRQFPGFAGRKDPFAGLLRALALVPGEPDRPRGGLTAHWAARWASLSGSITGRRAESATPAAAPAAAIEQGTFRSASRASQKHLISLLRGFLRHARRGNLSEGLTALAHLAPLAVSVAPYLVALHAQHKDAHLLEAASQRFLGQRPEGPRPGKKAWFTDTPTSLPWERGHELVAITCGRTSLPEDMEVRSFAPVLQLPIPGSAPLRLTLPPLLEILDHCERERYSEILISTPGLLGLAGLAAGKLLGIPVTGLYPTEFPVHLRPLAGSPAMEDMAWTYLRWFFGQMGKLYVARPADLRLLAGRGFDPALLALEPGRWPDGADEGGFASPPSPAGPRGTSFAYPGLQAASAGSAGESL